jgi:hypothetical protein
VQIMCATEAPDSHRHPLYGTAEFCVCELALADRDGQTILLQCEKLAHPPTERHEWWTGRVVGAPYAEVWWYGAGRTSFKANRAR